MTEDGAERRRFTRIGFRCPAHLDVRGKRLEGEVLDVSLKGALVALADGAPPPPAGVTATLTIRLDGGDAVIRMDGEVVHAVGGRIGFACEEIDLESVVHLRRLVEVNTGDDALLRRELAALVAERDW